MGKWAQQKKRGSASYGAGPSGPPPAPDLVGEKTGHLLQYSNAANNAGGLSTLEASTDGQQTWGQFDQRPWQMFQDWGDVEDMQPLPYRTTETGNGSAYVGTSEPSNVIDLT